MDSASRRAREKGLYVEHVSKRELWKADRNCGICGEEIKSFKQATLDHIIPLAQGGIHAYVNVQLSHEECNVLKGSQYPFEFDPSMLKPKRRRGNKGYYNRSNKLAPRYV